MGLSRLRINFIAYDFALPRFPPPFTLFIEFLYLHFLHELWARAIKECGHPNPTELLHQVRNPKLLLFPSHTYHYSIAA